jgi:hypothetical protein
MQKVGEALFSLGLVAAIVGLIMVKWPWLLAWFGKLPGDYAIPNLMVPLTSMVVISVGLSLVVNLFGLFIRVIR